MNFVDDAREIIFADPTDLPSLDALSLEEQIERAEFELKCAQAHLDELRAKKAAEDAHLDAQYQQHLEYEYGRISMESDVDDNQIIIQESSAKASHHDDRDRMTFAESDWINTRWCCWQEDYRCERPEPVTCEGCHRRYLPHESAGTMCFLGRRLVWCTHCEPESE